MASSEEEKKYIIVLADTLFFYGPYQRPDILLFRINVDKVGLQKFDKTLLDYLVQLSMTIGRDQ